MTSSWHLRCTESEAEGGGQRMEGTGQRAEAQGGYEACGGILSLIYARPVFAVPD